MMGTPPEQRLAELERFVERHHRLPRPRLAGESSLASWMMRVRNKRVMGASAEILERVLELEGQLPRRTGRPPARPVKERIAELHAFVVKHGRLPRERDPAEAPLARWLARPGSLLTPGQRATVDRIRAGYLYDALHRG